MYSFFWKILIFIACSILELHIFDIEYKCIAFMLVAFIYTFVDNVFTDNNYYNNHSSPLLVKEFLVCIFLIVGLFIPQLIIFIPVLLWLIFDNKLFISGFLFIVDFIFIIIYQPYYVAIVILFLSIFNLYNRHLFNKINTLSDKLKLVRDSSKEHSLLIEENNRALIENQDNQIHMATLRERNRIAREIHDNVGHMLTRSILQIGAIKTVNKDNTLKEPLNTLHDTLTSAMTCIRESVHDLHDESIDLKMNIYEIIKEFDTLNINFDYDMSPNIPKKVKYSFISIIKESINNTVKHSNGNNVTLLLREHPGFYQLLIEDDGSNIDTNIDANFDNGIGISNIKDRVKALNGNLVISTESGFRLLITIIKDNQLYK